MKMKDTTNLLRLPVLFMVVFLLVFYYRVANNVTNIYV